MNRFFTLLLAASCLTAVGQVTYPYNPDGNADGDIAVGDLQDFLGTYGNPFSPSEILVDGETLTTVLTQLQNSIDSLSGLTGSGGSVLDMPLGTVLPIATESVPEGWMLCDGREISIEEYQGLYDLIGTTYGAGDSAFWAQVFYPATTFNIPDLRGRTIIGTNDMGGESANLLELLGPDQVQLGGYGGSDSHIIGTEELPDLSFHIPGAEPTSSPQPIWERGVARGAPDEGISIEIGGNSTPFSIMQPFITLNYMMKVQVAEDVVEQLEELILAQQIQINALVAGPVVYRASDLEVFVAEGFYRRILPDDADVIINDAAAMWVLECPNSSQFRELKILSSTVNVMGQDMLLGHPLDEASAGHYFLIDGTWTSN